MTATAIVWMRPEDDPNIVSAALAVNSEQFGEILDIQIDKSGIRTLVVIEFEEDDLPLCNLLTLLRSPIMIGDDWEGRWFAVHEDHLGNDLSLDEFSLAARREAGEYL